MLIGFVDDTEIQVTTDSKQPDIYVFGGFFVEQVRLHELQERIADIKSKHGLQPWHPIKWNLKDLKKYYEKEGELEVYNRVINVSEEIRKAMLGLVPEFEMLVMACGLYRLSGTTENVDCYRWAFENLLQRVGLMVRGHELRDAILNFRGCHGREVENIRKTPHRSIATSAAMKSPRYKAALDE